MARKKQREKPRSESSAAAQKKTKKRVCQFCKDKSTYIDYKDVAMMRRYMSERGKIRARRVTGNCSEHQRDVASAVKNAREMALLPYATGAR
jgi:small subunit ribosomal protein S18